MGTKKDIGKAFKENLHEFKGSPNHHVWESIEAELKKEKKNRFFIALWSIASGIALLFLCSIFIFYPNRTEAPKQENSISNTDKTNSKIEVNTKTNTSINYNESQEKDKTANTSISNSNLENYNTNQNTYKKQNNTTQTKNYKEARKLFAQNKKQSLSDIENKEFSNTKNASNINNNKTTTEHFTSKIEDVKSDTIVDKTTLNTKETKVSDTEKEAVEKKIDSIEASDKSKWSLTASAIPTYYGSITKGSSLDENLKNNPKNNQFSFSYGAFINYEASEQITLRTGVLITKLNYTTNHISTTNTNGNTISIYDISAIKPDANPTNSDRINSLLNSNDNFSLTQKISYIEIPLEVKYSFKNNKKSNFSLIAGFSYFLLDTNIIEAFAKNTNTFKIGEANNLNDTSISINLGTGFKYSILKKLSLNIDAVFKYQLMSLDNKNSNNNPFILGLQSGLTYKF